MLPLVLALAAFADPPELVEATREIRDSLGGGAQTFTIDSAILEQARAIDVVLPPSFDATSSDRRYPVIVFFDAEENVACYSAALDHLVRYGLVPESILVGVENLEGASWDARVHDLTPPGLSVSGSGLHEGGERFLDFIEQELLPAVDRQFRGGAPRTMIGHSSGGILATWAAATRPAWRAVIAIDAPIHLADSWLAKRLIERAGASSDPLRYIYLGCRFDWPKAKWSELVAAAPETWRLHSEKLDGEAHETVGMIGAYVGLREAFRDWSRVAAPQSPTTRVLPYYESVSAALGAPLPPPKRVLRNAVEDLLMEGRGTQARTAFEQLVAGYGAPQDADDLLAQIEDVEKRPPPQETVESFLSAPFPTPDEAAAFVGDWIGDVWMNPEEPRDRSTTLEIRVVDGRVTGRTVQHGPDGEELVMQWEHLRITPDGLTWGFMNGMRPHGLLLFEGKLDGDTLAGKERMAGIDFVRPDGSRPPILEFEFERVK